MSATESHPIVRYVLRTYFARGDEGAAEFQEVWARGGEDVPEFEGLIADLKAVVRASEGVPAAVVNESLGSDISDDEARKVLSDFTLDLTAPTAVEAGGEEGVVADEEDLEEPTPRELLDGYFFRKVTLPWPAGAPALPLWAYLGVGTLITGAGILVGKIPTDVGAVKALAAVLIVIGAVIFLTSSLTMNTLRNDMREPARAAAREEEQAAAIAKAAEQAVKRDRVRSLFGG